MELSLEEAAVRLGKSTRQIRYMIRQNKISGRKVGGRWFVQHEEPAAARGAGGSPRKGQSQPGSPSLRDLDAFRIALPLYHKTGSLLREHPVTRAVEQVLELLALGFHRQGRSEKAEAWRGARDQASLAVCKLLLLGLVEADELALELEQELLPVLSEQLKQTERRPGAKPGSHER